VRGPKVFFLGLLVFFSCFTLGLASQKTIRVGIYQNKPKVFVDQKGRAKGFFIDILGYIADKEGWQITYVPGTWEQCLYRLMNRRIDLLVDVADSVTRTGLFDFTHEDVFSNWAAIYVPAGSGIDSVLDLRHRTIVAMKGDISYEEFRRKLKRLDIACRYKEVDRFADVFRTIDQKKADAGIISRLFGLQNENNYHVKRTEIVCCPKNLYFAVPKRTNKFIIDAIDRHLRRLKQDDQSVYYTSLTRWVEGISSRKMPPWLMWVAVSAAGLLVLFGAGNIVLKRQVDARTRSLARSNEQLQQAQADRENLLKQLYQSQKMEAIGTLAGGIAHDFNNILSSVFGYTEMALHDLPPDSRVAHDLHEVLNAATRARDLIRQILTFSRMKEQERRPILLQVIIKEVASLIRASIPSTITIRQHIDPDTDPVLGDPAQLHQVVMNLCTNAYQAMREHGGELTISLSQIDISQPENQGLSLEPGSYVHLQVSDSGIGMTQRVMQRMFDPYFTTKAENGTGIGLAVVHGIVKTYGGDIRAASRPGKGSTFHVYLPRLSTHEMIQTNKIEESLPKGAGHVLLVDDQEVLTAVLQRMLRLLGYRVSAFSTIEDALAAFKKRPQAFDLVVTDMTMPTMTGVALAAEIKNIRPQVPVILLSGFSDAIPEDVEKQPEIDAFLMKPVLLKELAETIRQVLEKTSG